MEARKTIVVGLVLALSLIFGWARLASALEVGQKAPDFELDSSQGGKLKLSSLKGKNVLINFYVLDFSPT
jgi:cytochrome oxidase Cu insertion factor (SCO1/SenC/PrrC family)